MIFSKPRIIFGSLIGFVLLIVVARMIFLQFYDFYEVVGSSMSPALKENEIYLVHKNVKSVQRGDIIVFYHPKEKYTFIKRVIGLPNETVEIRDNRVFINGKLLNEPYLIKKQEIKDFPPVRVPAGSVFVLGDDRVKSYDSRDFGMVRMDWIIGKIE